VDGTNITRVHPSRITPRSGPRASRDQTAATLTGKPNRTCCRAAATTGAIHAGVCTAPHHCTHAALRLSSTPSSRPCSPLGARGRRVVLHRVRWAWTLSRPRVRVGGGKQTHLALPSRRCDGESSFWRTHIQTPAAECVRLVRWCVSRCCSRRAVTVSMSPFITRGGRHLATIGAERQRSLEGLERSRPWRPGRGSRRG
jgi:hypothetical protein